MDYIILNKKTNMALVSENKPVLQLTISFIVGAIVSIGTAIVFGTSEPRLILGFNVPLSWIGFGISIAISIGMICWTRRIRSNRLVGSIGHVLFYSILTSIIQNLIFPN